jgi:ribulose-5-phosphate 4-epimerase/fuculose-1-phosphate aldolase
MNQTDMAVQLDELAAAHRILAVEGHEDRTSGHVSWRDPEGRGFWMKRAGIGMDEVRGAEDMLLVDFDGKVLSGTGNRHHEWPIHAEILRVRPDVQAVGHTHPFYSQIFASTDEPLRPIAKEGAWFDDQPKFQETCSLIRSPELGVRLAKTLGSADAVFLMSHGIAFVGTRIRECTLVGIYLEAAVKAQVTIAMTGFRFRWPDPEDARAKRAQTRTASGIDNYWAYCMRRDAATRSAASTHTG